MKLTVDPDTCKLGDEVLLPNPLAVENLRSVLLHRGLLISSVRQKDGSCLCTVSGATELPADPYWGRLLDRLRALPVGKTIPPEAWWRPEMKLTAYEEQFMRVVRRELAPKKFRLKRRVKIPAYSVARDQQARRGITRVS